MHLLTFTMRHHAGQALTTLWAALSAAWRSVTSGRAVERERTRWGVLGMVRVIEATHGEHGWHLHVHALVAFDGPVSTDLARELGGAMFGRWERALVRKGLSAPLEDRGGLDVRAVDLGTGSISAVADYLGKITAEVTASYAKEAAAATAPRSPSCATLSRPGWPTTSSCGGSGRPRARAGDRSPGHKGSGSGPAWAGSVPTKRSRRTTWVARTR